MLSWESGDIIERVVRGALGWADDVFVLDTGSTDGSRDVLRRLAAGEARLRFFEAETDAATFNHGRCINLLLEQLDALGEPPYWLAKLDCDEMFEPGFVEYSLPAIRELPRCYTEVSFRRPDLWYSEDQIFLGGPNRAFRERAFQRWRAGLRYPETQHHLVRTLRQPAITFHSRAYLLHYELRSRERSRLQYERLREIDTEWSHLLLDPHSPDVRVEDFPSLRERGGDRFPSTKRTLADLWAGLLLYLKRTTYRWYERTASRRGGRSR